MVKPDLLLLAMGALGAIFRRWSDPKESTWGGRAMIVDVVLSGACNVLLLVVAGEFLPAPTLQTLMAEPIKLAAAALLVASLGYATPDFLRNLWARRFPGPKP